MSDYIVSDVEQAFAAWLRAQTFVYFTANQIFAGMANQQGPDQTSEEFTIPLPSIVCVCQEGEFDAFGSQSFKANGRVEIRTNADDFTDAKNRLAVKEVLATLLTTTISADLSGALADFTAFLVVWKAQSWALEERSWCCTQTFEIFCCGADVS